MSIYRSNITRYTYIIIIAFCLINCTTSHTSQNEITVSIIPQKYIIDRLLDNNIKVNVMIPPGNSPATYSPSPVQIKRLHNSKLYLRIGYIGFENAWMDKITSINSNIKVSNISKGIKTIKEEAAFNDEHVNAGANPHIWISPKTMIKLVDNTKGALLKYFPTYTSLINHNYVTLINQIKNLDTKFTNALKQYKGKKILIYHPAYSYLARDYGLEQLAIEDKGKAPSVKRLQKIINDAKIDKINSIFIQKEFDTKNAKLIAEELNLKIITINPLAEDYIKEMNSTLNKLVNSFSKHSN